MGEKTSDEEKKRIDEYKGYLKEGCVPTDYNGWWWLSFADGSGFLGGAMVKGKGFEDAKATAYQLGIDPGGDVMGMPIIDAIPPQEWRERLLTLEECRQMDKELIDN